MRRRLSLPLLALVLALPAGAEAAEVGAPYEREAVLTDPDGVANEIVIRRDGPDIVFTDTLAPLIARTPCIQAGLNSARCQVPEGISVFAGAGDDKVTIEGTLVDPTVQNFVKGGEGDDTITGGGDRDWLSGNEGADRIFGGDGQDQLDGSHGADLLEGEGGSDSFFGGDGEVMLPLGESGGGSDVIRGGDGSDSISYWGTTGVRVTLAGGADDGQPGEGDDVTGVEMVTGSEGPDVLIGTDEADFLVGSAGDDTLEGGGGRDELQGHDGADTILAGAGDDRLNGGAGADRLDCGADRDLLEGTDPGDSIDASCEGHGGLPWGSPVLPPPPATVHPVPVSGAGGTAKADLRRRRLTLPVTCSGAGTCSGTLTVTAGKRRIGRAAYRVAAGARKTIRLELSASARRALKGRRSLKASVAGVSQPRSIRIAVRR